MLYKFQLAFIQNCLKSFSFFFVYLKKNLHCNWIKCSLENVEIAKGHCGIDFEQN